MVNIVLRSQLGVFSYGFLNTYLMMFSISKMMLFKIMMVFVGFVQAAVVFILGQVAFEWDGTSKTLVGFIITGLCFICYTLWSQYKKERTDKDKLLKSHEAEIKRMNEQHKEELKSVTEELIKEIKSVK